jgi:hypothetical protein
MLLVLSALALLAIVADTVLTATVTPGFQASFANFWLRYTLSLISITADVLALAAGIVALVAAAQHHQWGWFTGMFVLLLVSVYGLLLVYVALSYYVGFVHPVDFVLFVVLTGAMLAVVPLVTLVYSLSLTDPAPHKA